MSHRAVRVFVFLLAAACVGAGGYFLVSLQQKVIAERSGERVFEAQAHEAALLVERLRTAQQSYVAEGQGADYWMTRLADTRATLERTLTGLASTATAEPARTAATRALRMVGQHQHLDDRARTYMKEGQRLMASDLIFTESSGTITEIARAVDQARTEQRTASDARIDELERQQQYAIGGAAAAVLFLALLLVATGDVPRADDTSHGSGALVADGAPAGGALLRPDGANVTASAQQPPPAAARSVPIAPLTQPGASPQPQPMRVDMASTARLCADLARVAIPADVPPLLERAAQIVDASGVIVWVANREGAALFPMLAHGYAPAVLARMGSISRSGDNAAAAAFRDGELRTVAAHGALPGALVAPIITGDGCVGVLAAETRHGAERDEAVQAVAAIVAAQLATFVTALPAGQREE